MSSIVSRDQERFGPDAWTKRYYSFSTPRFWQRCDEIADQMRPEFVAEGNAGLMIEGEHLAILAFIQQNRHARYLYEVDG
jgi:hypothetical protein